MAAALASALIVVVSGWVARTDVDAEAVIGVAGREVVAFEVSSDTVSRVHLRYGNRVGSFSHAEGTVTYVVTLPRGVDAPQLVVTTDPQASVMAVDTDRGTFVYPEWRPEGEVEIVPPRLASGGDPAEATVDETDTYGLRLFGVPARTEPSVDAPVVATVYHGERLVAECWAEGDRVTNGFDDEDFDDDIAYESTVWFRVRIPGAGTAFVPDARFSRTADEGRLGLDQC